MATMHWRRQITASAAIMGCATESKPTRRTAGRRAVIWGVGGPPSSPDMTYWMIACTVYLYIAILGVNVRFCRDEVRRGS